MTTLQQQIYCTAAAWLDYSRRNAWIEGTRGNSEPWIKQIWTCYDGLRNLGSAYCVATAWSIINDALKLAGCANPIPRSNAILGAGHGNVYGTWYDARALMRVDATPAVGAIFARGNAASGFNHMGVVIGIDVVAGGKAYVLHTIEGNTSADGTGAQEGFVERLYTRELYDSYATVPIKPHASMPAVVIKGWQFLHVEESCAPATTTSGLSSCWGFPIECAPPPVNNGQVIAGCSVTNPPAPRSDDAQWGQWLLITDIDAAAAANTGSTDMSVGTGKKNADGTFTSKWKTPQKDTAGNIISQVDESLCWVRFRKDAAGVVQRPPVTIPPARTLCIERVVTATCAEGSIRVKYPTDSEVVGLAELASKGIREAMMSQVIPRADFRGRGYTARAMEVYDRFPVIKTDKGFPIVMAVESSDLWQIMQQQTLLGPSPLEMILNRTGGSLVTTDMPLQRPFTGVSSQPSGSGGYVGMPRVFLEGGVMATQFGGSLTGGGWAELAANLMDPAGTWGMLLPTSSITDKSGILASNRPSSLYTVVSLWEWMKAIERGQDEMRQKGSVAVVRFAGQPQSGWPALKIALSVIASVVPVPGVAPIVNAIISVASPIIQNGGKFTLDDIFNIAGAFVTSVKSVGGAKPLGVEMGVWDDIAKSVQPARRITNAAFGANGSVAMAARQLGQEIEAGNLQALESLARRSEFLDTNINGVYLFRRGLEAEIRSIAGSVSDVARTVSTAYNGLVSSAFDTASSLVTLGREQVDGLFGTLVTDASRRGSATEVPLLQDIFGSMQPELLQAVPGIHQVAGRIVGLQSTFRTDVTDAATYQALAGLGSGRKLAEGVLDSLQFRAIIQKAQDMQREGIHFTLPPVISEDKAVCLRQEIAICVGCPPGYRSYNFGCVPEATAKVSAQTGGTSTGSSTGSTGGTTGGTTSGSAGTTTPKIDLPPCITAIGSTFWYCPPPTCNLAATKPAAAAENWTTAIAVIVNDINRTPIEVQARRNGTGLWQDFTIRPMEPQGNGYQPGRIAWQPVQAGYMIGSTSITPASFQAAYVSQGGAAAALPVDPLASGGTFGTGTTTPASAATMPGACSVRYEARVALEPYPRWYANLDGVWTEIFSCCPKTVEADACCEKLMGEVGRVMAAIAAQRPVDLTPVLAAIDAAKAQLLAAIKNVSGGGTGTTYDDTSLRSAIGELKTMLQAQKPTVCPGCPSYNDSAVMARLQEIQQVLASQKAVDTTALERKVDSNTALLQQLLARPIATTTGATVTAPAPVPQQPAAPYDDAQLRLLITDQTSMIRELLQRRPDSTPVVIPPCPAAPVATPVDYEWFKNHFSALTAAIPKCQTLTVPPQAPFPEIKDWTSDFTALKAWMQRLQESIERHTTQEIPKLDTSDLTKRIDTVSSQLVQLMARPQPAYPERYDDTQVRTLLAAQSAMLQELMNRPPAVVTTSSGQAQPQIDYGWLQLRFKEVIAAIPACPSLTAPNTTPMLQAIAKRIEDLAAMLPGIDQRLAKLEARPATQCAPNTPCDTSDLSRRIDLVTSDVKALLARPVQQQITSTGQVVDMSHVDNLRTVVESRMTELGRLIGQVKATCPACDVTDLTGLYRKLDTFAQEIKTDNAIGVDTIRKDIADLKRTVLTQRPDVTVNSADLTREIDSLRSEWVLLRTSFENALSQSQHDPNGQAQLAELKRTMDMQTQRYEEFARALLQRQDEQIRNAQAVRPAETPVVPVVATPPPQTLPQPPQTMPPTRPAQPVRPPADCPDCPTTVERHEKYTYGNVQQQEPLQPPVPNQQPTFIPVYFPVAMPGRTPRRRHC